MTYHIEVILKYKRANVDKSTGSIVLATGNRETADEEEELDNFVDIEFAPMLYKFAQALTDYPDAQAVIQRTDREGLVPYNLDQQTANLFRTDPVAAVASMSTQYGSPSGVVARVRKEREPVVSNQRVGFDTLADAFGDQLFVRFDAERGRVECPCCGIWNPFASKYVCRNPRCAVRLELNEKAGKWVAFRTEDLLATQSRRFYFPRAWNGYKPWVLREDLSEKFQQFQKEKASCP